MGSKNKSLAKRKAKGKKKQNRLKIKKRSRSSRKLSREEISGRIRKTMRRTPKRKSRPIAKQTRLGLVMENRRTRKPIKPGIDYRELVDRYYVAELRDYCRENKIRMVNKKHYIAKNILAYHEDSSNRGYKSPRKKRKERKIR